MMKFDVETHTWLYKDDLDWFWKKLYPPHNKPLSTSGGGLSETAMLPVYNRPMYMTIVEPPIWINSPYLKETDKQKILSYVGKRVITTR